jgi:hypothetical protein
MVACLIAMAALFLAGCSGSTVAHPVNPVRAREALTIALEQWKNGAEARSLDHSATPIVVQDMDWEGGAKLINYQVVDEGKAYDANLRVQVTLMLGGQGKEKGKTIEKKVWYLVGTSPSLTVFRDMLRR